MSDKFCTVLSKKINIDAGETAKFSKVDEDHNSLYDKKIKRRTAQILKCPHLNQKHYAKGMCNHCYHKYGR
jgi:hypothetical protein